MHTHAHAPISSAQRSLAFSAQSSSPNAPEDAAEQFLSLLSKLVSSASAVSSGGVDIDAKPAELPEKKQEVREKAPEEYSRKAQSDNEDSFKEKDEEDPKVEKRPEDPHVTSAPIPAEMKQRENGLEQDKPVGANNAESKPATAQTPEDHIGRNAQQAVVKEAVSAVAKEAQAQVTQQQNQPKESNTSLLKQLNSQTPVESETSKQIQSNEKIAKIPENSVIPNGKASEEENFLIPANPELSELPKPQIQKFEKAAIQPVVKAATPVISGAAVKAVPLDSMHSKNSILDKALNALSKDQPGISALSLTGEKAKTSNVKEQVKGGGMSPRQAQIVNQIQKLVDRATQSRDGTSLSVRIEPEELGHVLVKMTQRGDQLFARIVPEKREVEGAVRAGLTEIISQLVNSGFKAENIHVSVGRESSETSLYESKQGFQASDRGNTGTQGEGSRHGSSSNLSQVGLNSNPNEVGLEAGAKVVDGGWVA